MPPSELAEQVPEFQLFEAPTLPARTRAKGKPKPKNRKQPISAEVVAALSDPQKVLFLDIETTGLSRYYDDVTIVGWLFDGAYNVFIAGDDPSPLLLDMARAAALVTFNGTLFDVPFLRKTFGEIAAPTVHVDLRYLGRRVGLTGGQKAIERELGISFRSGLEDVDGFQAVLLWHRYLRGCEESLRRLIDYNRCDVISMRVILDEAVERLLITPDLWLSPPRHASTPWKDSGWAKRGVELPTAKRLSRPRNTFASIFASTAAESATVVGIDLTGSEKRPSGWCQLTGTVARTEMVHSDDDMVARIATIRPDVVSIDSPLSIPAGRISVWDDDPGRSTYGIMRVCERTLKRRGINVYPCLLPSMQALTNRGMQLAHRIRRMGIPVIESYPGAAQDIMGIPRKGAGEHFLKQGLIDFGVAGEYQRLQVRHDELDAITSALVGSFFLAGKYEALGSSAEEPLIIPDLQANAGPMVIGISGRIAAGKTSVARFLESRGFAYTRFSLVVDDEITASGGVPDRRSRQKIGLEIHETKGQRWLCERVVERVSGRAFIVVDGLRFLEDRAFFGERFGSRFLHVHVEAFDELRARRYEGEPSFEEADSQPVEQEVDRLGAMAAVKIENIDTLECLQRNVVKAVEPFLSKSEDACLFPSS